MSECFVDVEDEPTAVARESIVDADVDALLEFPSVAYAGIWEGASPGDMVKIRKSIGQCDPCSHSVATFDVLSEFHLAFDEVLVAVASLIVASHAVVRAHFCKLRPRGVAVVEHAMKLASQHSTFPQASVGGECGLC